MDKIERLEKIVKNVQKRDGQIVRFEFIRIVNVISKAMTAAKEGSTDEADMVANKVLAELVRIAKKNKSFTPSVEYIQDIVEKELILSEYVATSKAFILYREKRAKAREKGMAIPPHLKKLSEESKSYFKNPLGEFVYYRSYARWIDAEQRRETWVETVDRYIGFMKENLGKKLKDAEYKEVRETILKQEAMPSMRLLQFAGPSAQKTNVCAYNCSYIAPSCWQDFAEIMYISMCGTGAGWSAESQNIQALPQIKRQTGKKLPVHVVADSREGWCDALAHGMKTWADGNDVGFDYSLVRPAGARLKTMGGKASGPEPLRSLLNFTREKMLKRQGRRLENLDAHDIMCKIGDCVVAGGVRRSAMISLSDLDDSAIRDAKKGQFYLTEGQRALSNNSAVYMQKPTEAEFLDEWVALMKSGSGERGIFNRGSLPKQMPQRRLEIWKKDGTYDGQTVIGMVGTNPCGEIILQSKQFCNLSEVVCRANDTEKSLLRKIRVATILGTYQSTLTNFQYLSKEWKENCERERLLGVSLTGQWDSPAVRKADVLRKLRAETIKVNAEYAKRFGITSSSCITCVKPSGTVSQTVDCSSGMHPRHSKYYIRRVRISATDSLFKMLRDQGVPYFPEVGQSMENANTYVFEFPVKSPSGSIFRDDQTAIEQLEYWKMVKENYTEHNPSVTISIGENEWIETAQWLFKNWDIIGGLSFLPRDNHVYQLAPYESIDEKRFIELTKKFEHVDYSKIITYEKKDETDLKKEVACAGGVCEIV
ncbi:MAG: ATP cone domain-containing protein [Candidatus Paceibacterota bacterium]|jgi:ribonucleoside-diphosphate reductase alpha chain